ncbi:MAG TPA: OmpA family protein, partial [Paracoccus sp. (in: a-proteobacteria)]|nr:OmpA family protein [Paracoccus sp. (in: a-proteobacteria)]
MRLSQRAEGLFIQAAALPPPDRAAIFRPVRQSGAAPPALTGPVVDPLLPAFESEAPPALRAALHGRETPGLVVLVVQASNPELFRSAKAAINPAYQPLIDAIGRTIAANARRIGGVAVSGHTDNVPVQRSNPFASNQGLSEARAENIAKALAAAGAPPEMLVPGSAVFAAPTDGNPNWWRWVVGAEWRHP